MGLFDLAVPLDWIETENIKEVEKKGEAYDTSNQLEQGSGPHRQAGVGPADN